MQLGRVVGQGIATVKHPTLHSWRLLLVQMQTADGKADGDPVLALDSLGAGMKDLVILTNDGKGTRELIGANNSPARWMVLGICD